MEGVDMRNIMFYSIKGGTGRTTILANLSYRLFRIGYSVGVIDLDIYSSGLSLFFNVPEDALTIQDFLENNDIELDEFINRNFRDISGNFNLNQNLRGRFYLLPSTNRIFEAGPNISYYRLIELINHINGRFRDNLDFLFYDLPGGLFSLPLNLMNIINGDTFLFYKNNKQNYYSLIYLLEYIYENGNRIFNPNNKFFLIINNSINLNDENYRILSEYMRRLYLRNFSLNINESIFIIPEIESLNSNSHLLNENEANQFENFKNRFIEVMGRDLR
jgi:cellulose biosynthesis protein BcsQ